MVVSTTRLDVPAASNARRARRHEDARSRARFPWAAEEAEKSP